MKNAARRLSAFGNRFARSGLRFARGGLRFSGRRRYAESALRVTVVVLVGAAIAYGGYLAVGLFFAFVAYILPYLFVFLAVAVLLAVGWFFLLAGNDGTSSAPNSGSGPKNGSGSLRPWIESAIKVSAPDEMKGRWKFYSFTRTSSQDLYEYRASVANAKDFATLLGAWEDFGPAMSYTARVDGIECEGRFSPEPHFLVIVPRLAV